MSQDDDHEQALEVAAATVHIDHTIEVRRARDFARTAITAYLSVMPQRELLREALAREEGVALVHSTASPAVIDPEKGWQASYDGAIAQGHDDEGAREVADYYWAHPADVAEKRNADRKDRLHLVDMAGLFAEDYARAALSALPERELLAEALDARLAALEEAAVIAETWFDHHRPQQPKKSRFNIYDIEHWAKSATRLVAEDIRARAAADKIRAALEHQQKGEGL